VLYLRTTEGVQKADLNDELDFDGWVADKPVGLGRFLFRAAALPPDLGTTLPYLDALSMHLLGGATTITGSRRCTLILDVDHSAIQFGKSNANEEREILVDYSPALFRKKLDLNGHRPAEGEPQASVTDQPKDDALEPERFSQWIDQLTPEEKTKVAVELAHSVPFPEFVKKIGFGLYRFWFKVLR